MSFAGNHDSKSTGGALAAMRKMRSGEEGKRRGETERIRKEGEEN